MRTFGPEIYCGTQIFMGLFFSSFSVGKLDRQLTTMSESCVANNLNDTRTAPVPIFLLEGFFVEKMVPFLRLGHFCTPSYAAAAQEFASIVPSATSYITSLASSGSPLQTLRVVLVRYISQSLQFNRVLAEQARTRDIILGRVSCARVS